MQSKNDFISDGQRIVTNLSDVHKWIENNQDYLCLKLPHEKDYTFYGLDSSYSDNKQEIVVCPFEGTTPQYLPIKFQHNLSKENLQSIRFRPALNTLPSIPSTSKDVYCQSVASALKQIQDNVFKKVVLAQTHINTKTVADVSSALTKMLTMADSYAYVLQLDQEMWIGASPELFFKSDYKTCETVALAGTRLTQAVKSSWGEKEIEEQKIVAEYIMNTFHDLGFSQVTTGTQYTKSVGHIEHICTPVTATLPEMVHWSSVLSNLHPTPALAGFPKSNAVDFIQRTETFSRGLYGGYLGVKLHDKLELFVNIRCAQLYKQGVQLYAGAGINAESVPDQEWTETENKLQVMRSILG